VSQRHGDQETGAICNPLTQVIMPTAVVTIAFDSWRIGIEYAIATAGITSGLKKGGLAMSHFTLKFWLIGAFAAVICLPFSGAIASGQTPPPEGNNDIVLSGFLGCGNPGTGTRECPMRMHYVNLTAGKMYAIQMASSEFNSKLVLEDMNGNMLACDTDYYDDLSGCIAFRPTTTGSYRLTVSAKNPTEGFYSVTVREMPVLMSVVAELTPNDPVHNDAFMSVHDVTLTAGRRYIIDLQSDEFDTFLKVLNPSGAIVAFADECGTMRNTRVIYIPTRTETYRIIATSYEPAVIGAFQLMVCEE
jgi:hypothetical protein